MRNADWEAAVQRAKEEQDQARREAAARRTPEEWEQMRRENARHVAALTPGYPIIDDHSKTPDWWRARAQEVKAQQTTWAAVGAMLTGATPVPTPRHVAGRNGNRPAPVPTRPHHGTSC